MIEDNEIMTETPVVEEAVEVVDNPKPEEPKKKRKKSKVQSIIEWVVTGLFAVIFVIAGIGQIDGMANAKKHYNQQIRLGFGSFIVKTNSMKEYPKGHAIITYLEKPQTVYNRWKSGKDVDVTFMGVDTYRFFRPTDVLPELNNPAYPEEVVHITHRVRYIYTKEELKATLSESDLERIKGDYLFIVSGTNIGGELAVHSDEFQAFTEKELLGTVKYGSPVLGWFFRVISSPIGLLIFLLIPALYLIITSSLDIFKALKTAEDNPAPSGVNNDTKKLSSLDNLSEADRKRLKEEMLEAMMKGKGNKNEGK